MTLREVSEALEMRFVSATWQSGDTDMKCLIASGMAAIMDDIYGQLDQLCQVHLDGITIQMIENRIFHHETQELL